MSAQTLTKETSTMTNGVNATAIFDTIQAIKADAQIAKFQFRAKNTWLGGALNRTTIKEFYGAGQEDTTRTKPIVLDADEPSILLGKDTAASPLEFVLHALASCMTTTLAYQASTRGIAIEAMESKLEGDFDLRGFLGLSSTVRKGYQKIRVSFRIKSKASPEKLTELAKLSPVYDVVSNSVPVDVAIETY